MVTNAPVIRGGGPWPSLSSGDRAQFDVASVRVLTAPPARQGGPGTPGLADALPLRPEVSRF